MKDDILIVDDDPSSIRLMAGILKGLGSLRFATSGAEALRLARESAPDLVLLDAEMPGMSGFRVCEALKAEPSLAEVPVIFVTGHRAPDFEVSGFDVGAADFIVKPVNPALMLARVKTQLRVKQMTDELRRLSTVDALTGIANRRCFDGALAREWRRARRGEPLALILADVDNFKAYNDHYGHPAGDACLRQVALALVAASQRPADLVARYGGEEFALLLPGTPRQGAQNMAHRVLENIEALAMPHAASPTAPHVTLSLGLAVYDDESAAWITRSPESHFPNEFQPQRDFGDLVRAADEALYAAKRGGRAQARLLDVADVDVPMLARRLVFRSRTKLAVSPT